MDAAGSSILARKLLSLCSLTPTECKVLDELPIHVREVPCDQDLVREGDRPTHCLILLDGFACRYRMLADGRRQILSFDIPGDFVDLQGFLLERLDHSIATLTPSRVGAVAHGALAAALEHPNVARALWLDTLTDAARFREWIVNVGRRTAYQRVAHVLCELATRLKLAGLADGGVCDLPITQGELADATGLSTVHVNRVIQELRRAGLIELRGRTFSAPDWDGLKEAAGFDPTYLDTPPDPRARAA